MAAAPGYIQTLRAVTPGVYSFSASWRSLRSDRRPGGTLRGAGGSPAARTNLYDSVARSWRTWRPAVRPGPLLVVLSMAATNSRLTLEDVTARPARAACRSTPWDSRPATSIPPLYSKSPRPQGKIPGKAGPGALSSLYVSLARNCRASTVSFTLAALRGLVLGDIAVTVTNGTQTPRPEPASCTSRHYHHHARQLSLEPRSGWLSDFVAWDGSRFVLPIVIAGILFIGLFLMSGVLAPKRNVLREYRDVL